MANDTNQNTVINAYPTKELFIEMLIKDITLKDAIGDLLDNSVDGALKLRKEKNYEGLWVNIELDAENGWFTIADNCGGITVEEARDYAFRFGRPEKSKNTPHSVGRFGIGMKRALFKLGNTFRIESFTRTSSFTMEVDVEKWKKHNDKGLESDWEFEFNTFTENEEHPEEKWGTTITVTELHKDVQKSFETVNDENELIDELQMVHLYSIDNGLEIRVQGKRLEAKQLSLLTSDKFKTAYYRENDFDSSLEVEMYAGVSEAKGSDTGWYIFCNDRLVAGPKKRLGWGVKKPVSIPECHSQFYRFRGYALLKAKDPGDLPWNTAKNGVDEDSLAYRAIFQKMLVLMRSVINFLNKAHYEQNHYKNKKIIDTPLQNALDEAKLQPLNDITSKHRAQNFVAPDSENPVGDTATRITYTVDKARYQAVGAYFGLKRGREIGLRTFDYFYNREIED